MLSQDFPDDVTDASVAVVSWNAKRLSIASVVQIASTSVTTLSAILGNTDLWLQAHVVVNHEAAVAMYAHGDDSVYAPIPSSLPVTGTFELPIGASQLDVRVTAEDGATCHYKLDLNRTHSTDTSLHLLKAHSWENEAEGDALAITQLSSAACPPAGFAPPHQGAMPTDCYTLDLENDESSLLLMVETSHSFFCSMALHACRGEEVKSSKVEVSAYLDSVRNSLGWNYRYGENVARSKGELQLTFDVPTGGSTLLLKVTAEMATGMASR